MALVVNQDGSNTILYQQRSFAGGMNLFAEDTDLGDTEYGMAFNVRNRRGSLNCANAFALDRFAPPGFFQGGYGIQDFELIFVSGEAYYKQRNAINWKKVLNLHVDPTVSRIYIQIVPVSSSNFNRLLSSTASDNIQIQGTQLNTGIIIATDVVGGSLAGIVVQDGINTPYFIGSDWLARKLQTYDQWTQDSREYVPIGKQMAFLNGKLFVVSSDGLYLYQSVTGRPIDFVVNIDKDGNKGGDATTTSYACSAFPGTALQSLPSATQGSGQLLFGTTQCSYIITLDYSDLIFGEPTYSNYPIDTGIINHFSVIEALGDYTWINDAGIHSFNAVQQLQDEGNNSVFSRNVTQLIENIAQNIDYVCAGKFNNFNFYSMNTTQGNVVLVYDTISSLWVSIDTFGVTIKQFFVLKGGDITTFYGISDSGVYQLYIPNTYLPATVTCPVFAFPDTRNEIRLSKTVGVFGHTVNSDNILVQAMVNEAVKSRLSIALVIVTPGITYPAYYPCVYMSGENVTHLTFDFKNTTNIGWKLGNIISWQSDARLITVECEAVIIKITDNIKQQATVLN